MRTWLAPVAFIRRMTVKMMAVAALLTLGGATALAQSSEAAGGEAALKLPDLSQVNFFNGAIDGHKLLLIGILFCLGGLGFGMWIYTRLKNLPVHRAMREISELIYETCKTYLFTQGKFILLLWVFIAIIILLYFGVLQHMEAMRVAIILAFSLVGIAGSYGVAWFGIRVNTFANSRTAFASLPGKPYPVYAIPLEAGMSIGMMLISVELLIMLFILLFVPGDYAGPCFIGFAIGESLGAAALRIAGGIFTKIADIGSDLMKIVFKIKEDDARNPGVIADCTGDNAGDSVGPSADGFETYGVTGVALITFILLGVKNPTVQVQLLVWIFVMRVMMLVSSAVSYFLNGAIAKGKYGSANEMNFEAPLTSLVWITSIVSIALTYLISSFIIPNLGGDSTQWWKLATIISCGTLAGAIIPELVKVFTSVESRHVKEVVTSAEEGGASLGILSGFVAGNFSGYYLGLSMMVLMAIAYSMSTMGLAAAAGMLAPAVFAFGLVAFGFLGMGPVTIAVDSYGPVTDNAQSVYELSLIEAVPNVVGEIKKDFNLDVNFDRAKHLLEANDGAGNTFTHGEAGADRHGRGGRDDDDFLDHHGSDQRADRDGKCREALAPLRAVLPGIDHGRRDDLLVYRRFHAGCEHGRLPSGRVHQGQHQVGRRGEGLGHGQQESSRHLHAVCAERDVEHFHRRLLRHTGVRLRQSVFLRGLSDFDRGVRALSSHFHGQRRCCVGQRQEDRGSRTQTEGHGTARRDGCG